MDPEQTEAKTGEGEKDQDKEGTGTVHPKPPGGPTPQGTIDPKPPHK